MRTYFAMNRNDFDMALNKEENGQAQYQVNSNTSDKQMEFNIINGVHEYFKHMSETFSLIREIDSFSPMSIDNVTDTIFYQKNLNM